MSFRQKLYLGYLIVFFVFLILLFPLATSAVTSITRKTLTVHVNDLITLADSAPNQKTLIRRLEEKQPYLFFRVSLLKSDGTMLYDSHAEAARGWEDPVTYLKEHPELHRALADQVGYHEAYSYVLGQRLAYVAKPFFFHGKKLILRASFPLKQIQEITDGFQIGFLVLGVIVLLLFSLMTSIIAFHLSRPIQAIIQGIRPYQEGKVERIPEIHIGKEGKKPDEFGQLASTLNSLNARIESQIETLRAERNEKEAVLESLNEGVVAVDAQMMVTDVNHTALEMLGMERDALVGHQFLVTGHQEFQDLLVACQQQGQPLTIATQLGDRKPLFLDVVALPKEIEQGAVLIFQDKSAYYRVIEMKKDFIANASHELKTPVTIVRGFAEALHDHPGMTREMLEEITGKMIRNCDRMERLVRNFLRLADIENLPRGKLEETDLLELVEGCKQTVLSIDENAEIEVVNQSDRPITLLADSDLLELAIHNLIENAAKYSKPPARVDIALKYIDRGERVCITVADHGIGIPAEDLEHIFQRFYTVNKARSRQLGGSGLGLSIVQTIIEKHFGTISVDSEMGQGTTFTLLLPTAIDRIHRRPR